MFFFFNDTATTEIYTLSLHDALPILLEGRVALVTGGGTNLGKTAAAELVRCGAAVVIAGRREEVLAEAGAEIGAGHVAGDRKSTSLNSRHAHISYAAFCLKKKYYLLS